MAPAELAESSDLVVVGTVTGKSDPFLIDPVSDKEPRFFTDVYVRADTVAKGTPQFRDSSDNEIVVRVEDGEGDGIATVNDGTPELEPGQQLALFLYQLKDGTYYNTEGNHYYIVGVGTGAWKMTSDGKFESPCWQQDGSQEISQDELTTVTGMAPADASKQPAEGTNAALDQIEADFRAGVIDEQQRQSYLDQAHREATEFARIMTPEEQAAYAKEAIARHAE